VIQTKKFVGVLAIGLVSMVALSAVQTSAASNGGKCTKAGVSQKTKGVTYTCVRSGKTLKWVRKPAKVAEPIVPAAVTGAQLLLANPPSPEPLSNCRLTELSELIAEIKKSAEWYSWFSQGNVKYNLRIADRWVRAPKTSENYYWLHPGKPGVQLMSSIDIAASYRSLAGSVVDTTGVTTVWAVLPKAITAIDEGFAWRGYPGTFSIGSDSYRRRTPIWQHFVHETLHSHGALGHSPKNGQIGLFWNTGSPGATLNSWDAMTLGWMKQENIYCVSKQNISAQTLALVPLEREQVGLRSVVIKISDYEALVIESHRKDKWSERWPDGTTGVSVMRVDTRNDTVWDLGSSTGTYVIPARDHSLDFMKVGQFFTTDGIKISLVASGDNDQIRIEQSS
jgi:hypothetical protein